MEFKYTDDLPKEPGYYWHRTKHQPTGLIWYITDSPGFAQVTDGFLYVTQDFERGVYVKVSDFGGEWAGPIPEPDY